MRGILLMKGLKGDLTQRWEDRKRLEIGEEAYAHLHWDTVVTNGRVLLRVESWKHPEGAEPGGSFSIPARWFWCMDQVRDGEDVRPALSTDIERIPWDVLQSLQVLPELQIMEVRCVRYWSSGRGQAKKKTEPPPDGLMFFKFAGGTGVCIAAQKSAQVRTRERKGVQS